MAITTRAQHCMWAETMGNGQHSMIKGKPKVASISADRKSLTPSKVAQLQSIYFQQIEEFHEFL